MSKFRYAHSMVYVNVDHTAINALVHIEGFPGVELPYTFRRGHHEADVAEFFERLASGEFGLVGRHVTHP